MTKKTAVVLVGLPGSGKSTMVKHIVSTAPVDASKIAVFSLDEIRIDMYAEEMSVPREDVQYARAFAYACANDKSFDTRVNKEFMKALEADLIIIDNVNATAKARARYANRARQRGFRIEIIQCICPLEVVIARQHTRGDKSVPERRIREMQMQFQTPIIGVDCDSLTLINTGGN